MSDVTLPFSQWESFYVVYGPDAVALRRAERRRHSSVERSLSECQ